MTEGSTTKLRAVMAQLSLRIHSLSIYPIAGYFILITMYIVSVLIVLNQEFWIY